MPTFKEKTQSHPTFQLLGVQEISTVAKKSDVNCKRCQKYTESAVFQFSVILYATRTIF